MKAILMNSVARRTAALPLRHGQRLTQAEFHRRYEACPEDVKFELIGGVVYMASPQRRRHGPSKQMIEPNRQGIAKSRVFPGLWVDVPALLERDSARLQEVIQQGIASRSHAAFVKRLAKAHRRGK